MINKAKVIENGLKQKRNYVDVFELRVVVKIDPDLLFKLAFHALNDILIGNRPFALVPNTNGF